MVGLSMCDRKTNGPVFRCHKNLYGGRIPQRHGRHSLLNMLNQIGAQVVEKIQLFRISRFQSHHGLSVLMAILIASQRDRRLANHYHQRTSLRLRRVYIFRLLLKLFLRFAQVRVSCKQYTYKLV